jgi:hypothetical protein
MTIVSRMLERSYLPKGDGLSGRNHPAPPRIRAAVIWEAALDVIAPLGYEDETGFHYGTPPAATGWIGPDAPESSPVLNLRRVSHLACGSS